MTPREVATVGRRATSLLALTTLLLFQLLVRADLASIDFRDHGAGIFCAGVDQVPSHSPNAHRACAMACATVGQAQILPPSHSFCPLRSSRATSPVRHWEDAPTGLTSIQSLRIRGPPELNLI